MGNFIYTFKLYTFNFFKYLRSILHNYLKNLSESEFHTLILKSHILALLPSPIQIQNLSNSLDHIYHLVSLFSLPTLFFDGFALYNNLVCQKIVTRSAGSSVAAGCFGARGIGNSSVVAAVCLVFECMGCSAGEH